MKVALIFTTSQWSASGQWSNQFNGYAPRLHTSRKPAISNAAVRAGILQRFYAEILGFNGSLQGM